MMEKTPTPDLISVGQHGQCPFTSDKKWPSTLGLIKQLLGPTCYNACEKDFKDIEKERVIETEDINFIVHANKKNIGNEFEVGKLYFEPNIDKYQAYCEKVGATTVKDAKLGQINSRLEFATYDTHDTKAFMRTMLNRYRLLVPQQGDKTKRGPRLAALKDNKFSWIYVDPLEGFEFNVDINKKEMDKNTRDVLKLPGMKSKALEKHKNKKNEDIHDYLDSKSYKNNNNNNSNNNVINIEDESDDEFIAKEGFEDGSPPARNRRRLNANTSDGKLKMAQTANSQNEYKWRAILVALTKHKDDRVRKVGTETLVCIYLY